MDVTKSTTSLEKPRLIFNRIVYEKISHMVQRGGSHECSGLGVTRIVGKDIYVDDVIMVKQTNAASTTDMEHDAVAKAMYHFREHEGTCNFWWHSHADMSVFWSGTDNATIRQIAQGGMCVAAVFNKRREVRAAVACQIYTPFSEEPVELFLDEIPVMTQTEIPDDIKAAWDKEYDDNVEKKVWVNRGLVSSSSSNVAGANSSSEGYYFDGVLIPWGTPFSERQDIIKNAKEKMASSATKNPADAFGGYGDWEDYGDQYPFGNGGSVVTGSQPAIEDKRQVSEADVNGLTDDLVMEEIHLQRKLWMKEREEIVKYHDKLGIYEFRDGSCEDADEYALRIMEIEERVGAGWRE